MVISDLNPKAQVAAVTDGNATEIMINGSARDIMKMIEETVTRIMMICYKDSKKEDGEEEAAKKAVGTMQTFIGRVSKSVMIELTKERLGDSLEGAPDVVKDALAQAIAESFIGSQRGHDDDEDEDEEEEEDEE